MWVDLHRLSVHSPASRRHRSRSRSTIVRLFPTMEDLATRTNVAGPVIRCRFSRNASRIKRRTRLRTTAPPSLRLVTNPRRTSLPSPDRCQLSSNPPQARRSPTRRRRANSREPRKRCARPKLNPRCWPGCDTALNRRKSLPAFVAAVADHRAATPGRHACPESELPFAPNLRRLILTFHDLKSVNRGMASRLSAASRQRAALPVPQPATRSPRRYQRRKRCQETRRSFSYPSASHSR